MKLHVTLRCKSRGYPGFSGICDYDFTLDASDLPDERDLRAASSTFETPGLMAEESRRGLFGGENIG